MAKIQAFLCKINKKVYRGYRMEYLTSADCAKKWNISQRRVAIYCKEGRIEGAIMMGRMWMIPKEAKKPEDPRKTKRNMM